MIRVPYPMGFYTRSLDGRIDDPNGGWKGRGIVVGCGDPRGVAHRGRLGDETLRRALSVAA